MKMTGRVLAATFATAALMIALPEAMHGAHTNPTVIATITVGDYPEEVAVDSATGRVYAINADGDTVSIIDGASNSVIATVPVGDLPHAVAVNSATGRVYVANLNGSSISVIDATSNLVIATVAVGFMPEAIAAL